MSVADNVMRRLLARHLQSADSADVLRLAEAVLDETPRLDARAKLSVADGRWMRVDHDRSIGLAKVIPSERWAATWDRETDIVWSHVVGNAEDGQPWAESVAAAQALSLFGVKCDAPDIRQQLSIIVYDRVDPAVDPEYFRGPYGYHWTKTPAAGSAGRAWDVVLDGGDSGRYFQSYRYLVRGVCAGQQLGFRI